MAEHSAGINQTSTTAGLSATGEPVFGDDAVHELVRRLREVASMSPDEVVQRLSAGDQSVLPQFEVKNTDELPKLRSWESIGRATPGRLSAGEYEKFLAGDSPSGTEEYLTQQVRAIRRSAAREHWIGRISDALAAMAGVMAVVIAVRAHMPWAAVTVGVLALLAFAFRAADRRESHQFEERLRQGVFDATGDVRIRIADSRFYRTSKRLFDVTVGSVLLLVFVPVLAIVALAIRLESKGPAFVAQRRLGKDGKTFKFLKLRTMFSDASARIQDTYAAEREFGLQHAMRDDPRVTRTGRLLRRIGIDELPSLWNVVTGDMSLVGPRPEWPEQLGLYGGYRSAYLSVKPGIASLSTVSSKRGSTWQEMVAYDIEYVRARSWSLDIAILRRSLRAALLGRRESY